jgi:hypothetical protein
MGGGVRSKYPCSDVAGLRTAVLTRRGQSEAVPHVVPICDGLNDRIAWNPFPPEAGPSRTRFTQSGVDA